MYEIILKDINAGINIECCGLFCETVMIKKA